MYDINVIARVENLSEDTSTVVGGLAGMYALSKKADTQENRLAMKIDKVVMPQKTEKTYTKISGGKSMGGLVGEAAEMAAAEPEASENAGSKAKKQKQRHVGLP